MEIGKRFACNGNARRIMNEYNPSRSVELTTLDCNADNYGIMIITRVIKREITAAVTPRLGLAKNWRAG